MAYRVGWLRSASSVLLPTLLLLGPSACRRSDPKPSARTATSSAPAPSAAGVPAAAAPSSGPAAPAEVPRTAFAALDPSALRAPASTSNCALDQIAGNTAGDLTPVPKAAELALVGWAAEDGQHGVPPVVVIELAAEGKRYFAGAVRQTPRPDVAQVLGSPALVASGWDLRASLDAVEPGVYAVHVHQVTSIGSAIVCDTRRKLDVK